MRSWEAVVHLSFLPQSYDLKRIVSHGLNERVRVMETSQFFAMEMADTLLTESNVPHFIVEFTRSGASVEMPRAPAFGRGFQWYILVSQENALQAEAILSALAFDGTADECQPAGREETAKSRRWWGYYLLLLVILLILIFYVVMRGIN